MKIALIGLALLTTVASVPASELIEPFPSRTAEDPMLVESPVRIRLSNDGWLHVEIYRDGVRLFPLRRDDEVVVSGVEFHLDPGIYRVVIAEPAPGPSAEFLWRETTYIQVPLQPRSFDLRATAAAVNAQMQDIRARVDQVNRTSESTERKLDAVATDLDGVRADISDLAARFTRLEDSMQTLIGLFKVTDPATGKPVPNPLQAIFDNAQAGPAAARRP